MSAHMVSLLFLGAAILSVPAQPLQRVANTTLRLPAQPPLQGYAFTNAFPGVTFSAPMVITAPPGETNRLFVAERSGRIVVITNLAAPTRTIFMDFAGSVLTGGEEGLLGLAFHPGYATNRYFFAYYSVSAVTSAGSGRHQRVARVQTQAANPNSALTNSLTVFLEQYDEANNHNAGDIHFGPDGYLYIAVGDEGGGDDSWNNSQAITKDLFSGILRIDVDKRPGNLAPNPHSAITTNYLIPADNPFVGATSFNGVSINPASVRTEFYAVGLRNPFRMSFDPATGNLYCGDVGQGAREEVNLIVRGGNYGWAYREGTLNGPKAAAAPPGFTSIPPIHEYGHCGACSTATQSGNSITGGVMYRGTRISQLVGKYVFTDYVSGHIWALTPNGMNTVTKEYLFTDPNLAAFGTDPRNGDILAADLAETQLKRLVYNATSTGAPLPATLTDTGAFADNTTLTPNPGIVGYDLNVPFWSDNARKQRWFSIPNTNLDFTFTADGAWLAPTGTVWIKHFELELTNGVPESRRRLETRFLVRNAVGVYGTTYRWGGSVTNATLVPEAGLDESFTINEGGILRTQVWHYPSRGECLACHTIQGGLALGFSTAQLNRDFNYNPAVTNQIAALAGAGYVGNAIPGIYTLRALQPAGNGLASLETRVRSYLAANCVQCHQPGGAAPSGWDARFSTLTAQAGLVDALPRDNAGNPDNRVIKPGSLANSILLSRISTLGPGRMPPLASSVLDTQGVALVSAWITNELPSFLTFPQWQTNFFGNSTAPNTGADEDYDADRAGNYLEFLTGTQPHVPGDGWKGSVRLSNGVPRVEFPAAARRAFEVQASPSVPPVWSPLQVPENRPFFAVSNRTVSVADPGGANTNRYYRVKVIEH